MSLSISSDQLTTSATKVERTKYFPIELSCSGMKPLTSYTMYYDGVDVGAFCKPFGGNLGDLLTSDANGKITIMFLMSVQYKQQFLVVQNPENNVVNTSKVIELRSPGGDSSFVYIPMVLKAGN